MIYENHFVLLQEHCIFTCGKLLGVLLVLHLLAIARNQHSRHGRLMKYPYKFFIPQTQYHSRNGYIRTDCSFYVRLVKHDLQDG